MSHHFDDDVFLPLRENHQQQQEPTRKINPFVLSDTLDNLALSSSSRTSNNNSRNPFDIFINTKPNNNNNGNADDDDFGSPVLKIPVAGVDNEEEFYRNLKKEQAEREKRLNAKKHGQVNDNDLDAEALSPILRVPMLDQSDLTSNHSNGAKISHHHSFDGYDKPHRQAQEKEITDILFNDDQPSSPTTAKNEKAIEEERHRRRMKAEHLERLRNIRNQAATGAIIKTNDNDNDDEAGRKKSGGKRKIQIMQNAKQILDELRDPPPGSVAAAKLKKLREKEQREKMAAKSQGQTSSSVIINNHPLLDYYKHARAFFEIGYGDENENEMRLRYSGSARVFFGFLILLSIIFFIVCALVFASLSSSSQNIGLGVGFLVAGVILLLISITIPTARITTINVKTGTIVFYKESFFFSFAAGACCSKMFSSCNIEFEIDQLSYVRQYRHSISSDSSEDNNQNKNKKNNSSSASMKRDAEKKRIKIDDAEEREQHDEDENDDDVNPSQKQREQAHIDIFLGFGKTKRLDVFLEPNAIKGEVLCYSSGDEVEAKKFAELLTRIFNRVKEQRGGEGSVELLAQ